MDPKNLKITDKTPRQERSIRYITKDFVGFRNNLMKYLKSYFPDTIKDFHPASSGMMMLELDAYVGDVLAYYIETAFHEMFLEDAVERKNVYRRANFLGYTPPVKGAAQVSLDVYAVVPAIMLESIYVPNENYTPYIQHGMRVQSNNPHGYFETTEPVDFSINTQTSPRQDMIYEYSGATPIRFLLKKSIPAVAGQTRQFTFTIDNPQEFLKIKVPDSDVIDIISVKDSQDNTWYEVDYLAQDTVFYENRNIQANNAEYFEYEDDVPYLLRSKVTNKRFTTECDHIGNLHMRFGAGVSFNTDDELIDNPYSFPLPIISASFIDKNIDPNNYLKTKTLGEAPFNTTFTIDYRVGGGKNTNVPSNTITSINKIQVSMAKPNNIVTQSDPDRINTLSSITVNNPNPATGGSDFENLEHTKHYASAFFAAQNRVVTAPDYIARVMSMPSRYGAVAKVNAAPTYLAQNDSSPSKKRLDTNPYGINLYVLSYDNNGKLAIANNALKSNIKNYLSRYRMLTDGINILDGKIIDIRIRFHVKVLPSYNKNIVLTECISNIAKFFNTKNWQFSQPIIKSELVYVLQQIEGVQAVKNITIENIYGGNYSNAVYDIQSNTYDDTIYPSRQISIFQVRLPENDILGTAS